MIKVVIERRCRPGTENEMERLLVELRTKAIHQRGYVSGETLKSVDDPSLWLVLSSWLDVNLWKAWQESAERQEIASKMEPLLITPEKVSVFSFIWDASWWS